MCEHTRGDWIREMGFWLCADCFERRDGPVIRYGSPQHIQGAEYRTGPQIIVWQSEVAKADDTTLNDFLRAMVRRFMQKTRPRMDRGDAYDVAINALKDLGDAYGDKSYDWSASGAKELADDEMQYWDAADETTN